MEILASLCRHRRVAANGSGHSPSSQQAIVDVSLGRGYMGV